MPHPPRIPGQPSQSLRTGFKPPPPPPASGEAHVETQRIDPKQVFDAAALAKQGKTREQDLMEHGTPIDLTKPPPKPEDKKDPKPAPILTKSPPKDPMEAVVSDDLITKLEQEFGFERNVYVDKQLDFRGKKLTVTLRRNEDDDFLWAMAIIARMLRSQGSEAIMSEDVGRSQVLRRILAARMVIKIEGKPIWDLFKKRKEISAVVPNWDGESVEMIPDFMRGVLAQEVYELFRAKLHPDLMFALLEAVDELDMKEEIPKEDESKEEPKDPSSAT